MAHIDRTFIKGIETGVKTLGNAVHKNGRTTNEKIALEMLGFGVAEVAAMLVGFGVYGAMDKVAPQVVSSATDAVAKTVIEPNLEHIEHAMNKACRLEECKIDDSVPREERAKKLARTLVLFGASSAAIFATEVSVRRGMNHAFGLNGEANGKSSWKFWKLSPKEKWIIGSDKVAQIGSMVIANMGVAGVTDELIRSTQSMLVKTGMPEDKAHELAGYTMIWELPNFLGLMAGLTAIYATHKYPKTLGLPTH